jgi:hypothetical protein
MAGDFSRKASEWHRLTEANFHRSILAKYSQSG